MVDAGPIAETPGSPHGDGARLDRLLKPADLLHAYLPSLRPTERLKGLPAIDGIILVGPKKSGKHPLRIAVQDVAEYDATSKGQIKFPQRWTTRQVREGEDDVQRDPIDFANRVKAREIDFYWSQPESEGDRPIRFGYKVPSSGIPIYLGTSSFITNPDSVTPHDSLSRLLVIGLNVPFEQRRDRFLKDLPDYESHMPDEVLRRLLGAEEEKILSGSHIIVSNDDAMRDQAPSDLVKLVKTVVGLKTLPSNQL